MTSKQEVKVPRKTKWYLHAVDGKHGSSARGNEVIATSLQRGPVDDEFSCMECADRVKRHLYEVDDYLTASRFYNSQKDLKATFEIFRSQNGSLPRKWEFVTPKKITLKKITGKSDAIKLAATMSVHRKH